MIQWSHFAVFFPVCRTICQVFLPPPHIHNNKQCISGTATTACCLTESAEPSITHYDLPDNLLQCRRMVLRGFTQLIWVILQCSALFYSAKLFPDPSPPTASESWHGESSKSGTISIIAGAPNNRKNTLRERHFIPCHPEIIAARIIKSLCLTTT